MGRRQHGTDELLIADGLLHETKQGTDLQCDEYPFASTKEGSTKGDNRFSVRLIDGDDNETGGRRLDQMYTLNRILDGDAFYMKITD
ncbi:NucA/NucB deoxyribonuclease domain-containing protein [Streptomyces sp. NPDC090057]|uniref:NucA/NucB deoxyribonuclease domain-containing protein n=1 Tax=Streptomyces sp. NPDC090057 TaxID=3365935 RepID=UPI003808B23A